MERKKSRRWSFKRKVKVKKDDTDHKDNGENSATNNFPVLLAEIERLRNENTSLKGENIRLRQKMEFKEVTDRSQNNDFVFPRNHLVTVEQDVGQAVAEVETENRTMNDLAKIGRQLERHMSLCEDCNNRGNTEEICNLRKTIESLEEQIKEFMSGQKYDTNTITKDKGTWSDREVSMTVDSRCASLDKLNRLLENHAQYTQKFEMMEELLAKEMHATCSLQQKLDPMQIKLVPDRPQIKKIPLCIKALAWKLQSCMVTLEKVKDFGRHLGLEPDLVNRLAEENKHSLLDAFWSSICCWCDEHGDNASVDLLKQSCIEANIDVFSRGPFLKSHRQALEMTITDLEEDLYPSAIISHLRSKTVLDASDVYYLTSHTTRRERVTALVSLLPLFGEEAFDIFLNALEVSDHPHLATALRNNLASCSSCSEYDTTPKHCGRRGQAPVDASLEASTDFPCGSRDLMLRILATVLTSSKHTEALMMEVMENSRAASLPGSQISTLSRSNTGTMSRSNTGTMTRSGQQDCCLI